MSGPSRIRVGPGEALQTGLSVTQHEFEYREAGRVMRAVWDPRETSTVCVVETAVWHEPKGAAITEDERERVYEGLWRIVKQAGAKAMLESLIGFTRFLPVRWKRGPNGFLVNIHDAGRLDYMRLGAVAVFGFKRDPRDSMHIHVEIPSAPSWASPSDTPISEPELTRLLERLRGLQDSDLWIGSGRPFRVSIQRTGGQA